MSRRKDDKRAADAAAGGPEASGICVAGHPRSARAIRRAKGLGGLLGALLATGLALGAHLPLPDAMLRGLAGGIVGHIALWAIAVAVARQLVIAEVRTRFAEVSREAAAVAAAEAEAA